VLKKTHETHLKSRKQYWTKTTTQHAHTRTHNTHNDNFRQQHQVSQPQGVGGEVASGADRNAPFQRRIWRTAQVYGWRRSETVVR